MNEGKSRVQELEGEGWTKRFVANEPRLSEAVEMYRQAGFEVHLEPLPKESECEACPGEDAEDECRICFEGVEDQYRVIFTRPKKGETAGSEEDLY
jgi:hypothetical protein